ncbi:MAG: response regulator [Rhizomicrobium sp.]|nr:response regulator [Rhizomicrobium sp.]
MAKTIMTVDDSPSVRQCIRISLSGAGYSVVEAADGQEAFAKFQNSAASMVITDLNMPNVDGIELIKKVRATTAGKFIPIIFLTTESDNAVKDKARAAGASGWISKPFNEDKLLAIVKKLLGS